MHVHLVTRVNAAGLGRDVEILRSVLTGAGMRVSLDGLRVPAGERGRMTYDVNLFVQHVVPEWFDRARENVLLPNPEWFREEWLPHLGRIDRVLCKTRMAERIFGRLGCRTEFVGFTSLDRGDGSVAARRDGFLHVAGQSLLKGTRSLVDLWSRHADWPRLTVVQHPKHADPPGTRSATNLETIAAHLDDGALRRLQRAHGTHLCPSEAEGFGHSIVEAMSCGAVVVATDAPPMNEVVAPERGLLVATSPGGPVRLGTTSPADPAALERAVETALAMDEPRRLALGRAARDWFLANDREFRRRIVEALDRPRGARQRFFRSSA